MKKENVNTKKYNEEINKWKKRYVEAVDKYIKSGLKRDYDYASWIGQYVDGMKKAKELLLDEKEEL